MPAVRELFAFLQEKGIGPSRAARELGVSHPSVLAWKRGSARPKAHQRTAIKVWTGGRVTESMWLTEQELRQLADATPFKEAGLS